MTGSQRAAIYARVSSTKQRDANTIESQLTVLRKFIAAQGWSIAGEYIDDGRSAKAGKLDARDGFARLVRDAAAKVFDVLVVFDVSRLTRTDDMRERAEILAPFQQYGIDIVTPNGGRQDLRTMLGELYITLHAAFAAEDNRKRASAIKAGKTRAIAEGRKPAGPTPYGLSYSRETGQWSLNPETSPIVVEIFRRVIAGESCMAIADDLHARRIRSPRGDWDRHKVWRLARSRHPAGEWLADKRRHIVLRVPAMIDEETWQAAQAKLIEHGKRGLVKTKHVYLLEGLATCECCGSPIAIRSATFVKRRGYANPAAYVCRARKLGRRGEERCDAEIVTVAELDALVWGEISAALSGRELAIQMQRMVEQRTANRRGWESDVKTYRGKLEKLAEREVAILARYQRGMIGDAAFDQSLASFRRERLALEAQIRTAEQQAAGLDAVPEVDANEWLAELRAVARNASPSDRQSVVRKLVKPGSAVLGPSGIRLTLLVGPGSRAESADVLAVGSGCRTHRGNDLAELQIAGIRGR